MHLQNPTDFRASFRASAGALLVFLFLFASLVAKSADSGGSKAWPDSAVNPARFTRITTEDGLSSADVRAIAQDEQGFLWFGTNQSGLDRYDGHEIKVYQNDPADPGSLGQNYIWALLVDREGVLWVGTGGGLDRYDRERDAFVHFRFDPGDPSTLANNIVLCLFQDSRGDLWVGTRGGLSRLDKTTGRFVNYRRAEDAILSPNINSIRCIMEDPATGLFWLGTSDGLCAFDRRTGLFTTFCREPFDTAAPGVNSFNAVLKSADGTFWAASEVGFASFLPVITSVDGTDPRPRVVPFRILLHDPAEPATLSDNDIRKAILDHRGRIWACTQSGLDLIDTRTGAVARQIHEADNVDTIGDRFVNCVLEDRTGIIWVGTRSGGVSRLRDDSKPFVNYRPSVANNRQDGSDTVNSLCFDSDGRMWLATQGGIHVFDGRTWVHYVCDPLDPETISSNRVSVVAADAMGQIWAGTSMHGLNRFEAGRFHRYPPRTYAATAFGEEFATTSNQINTLLPDRAGGLWIGARIYGLDYWRDGKFTHYPPVSTDKTLYPTDNPVLGVLTADGALWYPTEMRGLVRFDPARREFNVYLVNPSNPESEVNRYQTMAWDDHAGSLWVSSTNGLDRFDLNRRRFVRHYTKADGLPSSTVTSVIGDDQGRLWLGTDHGLSRFDPSTGAFRNFSRADGIAGDHFTYQGAFRGPDGRLYFAGYGGVTAFHPDQVRDDPRPPPVVLTRLVLLDKVVHPGDRPGVLDRAIHVADTIRLRPDQRVFSLGFAALDYSAPSKNRFAFQMEGFDPNWRDCKDGVQEAFYTNIPPGEYTFRVRATNADGVWNLAGATIRVVVTPAWYETRWFRASTLIAMGLAILLGFRLRVRRMRARNTDLMRQINERREQEEAIRASEERFRALYDDNPAMYFTVDERGRILSVNAFGAGQLGYAVAELKGRLLAELFHPDDRAALEQSFRECLERAGSLARWELRKLRKDGSVLSVKELARSVRQANGDRWVLIVSEDITERATLEAQLRQVQKMEAMGQLAGGVAHDFNNLLSVILGQAELSADPVATPSEQRESLDEIKEAALRGRNLTRQLLVFSRRQAMARTPVDLDAIVRNLAKMLVRLIGEHIALRLELSPEPLPILADSAMIEQVLVNLAVNARDAMPGGGVLTIRTRREQRAKVPEHGGARLAPGAFAALEVLDTGTGIPENVLPHLFEPFFTTKEIGRGTGLGLATSLGIVQQHQGWVEVESPPGAGATLRVLLPITEALQPSMKPAPAAKSGGAPGATILLVEDEPAVRRSAALLLARAGYVVYDAGDGEEALRLWQVHRERIDLLLSDLVMPAPWSGRVLAAKLRSERPGLPVAFMSGYDPTTALKGDDASTVEKYLQKPFTSESLLAHVRSHLEH
jgi:PAS domain S-box-containing protein